LLGCGKQRLGSLCQRHRHIALTFKYLANAALRTHLGVVRAGGCFFVLTSVTLG
jgi:hypothetical protein